MSCVSIIQNLEEKKFFIYYVYINNFISVIITKFNINVEENTNSIIIENFDSKKKKELEKKIIGTFIKTWSVYFFQKIKFKGKGYKIKKKKNQ